MTKTLALFVVLGVVMAGLGGCKEGNPQQSEADKYPQRKALPLDQIKAQEAKAAGHYGPPPSQMRPGMNAQPKPTRPDAPPQSGGSGPKGPGVQEPTSSVPGGSPPIAGGAPK